MADFMQQLKDDINTVFMKEMSKVVTYSHSGIDTQISVQFFEDSLDKMGTLYNHIFLGLDSTPNISKADTFLIDSILYGVIDFTIDTENISVNVFLQKV